MKNYNNTPTLHSWRWQHIAVWFLYFYLFLLPYQISYASQPAFDKKISLRFENAPTKVVLQALADHQQLNLLVAETFNENLTIRLEDVSWQQALDVILQLIQAEIELKDNVMLVIPTETLRARKQLAQDDFQKTQQQRPLSLLNVELQNQTADHIIALLNEQKGFILSERAHIASNHSANLLLIHDYPEQFEQIKAFIHSLDKPQQQVQITAYIVTMSDEGLQELGVRWGMEESQNNSSHAIKNMSVDLGLGSAALQSGFNLAKISGRILSLELSALELESQVEIIASPRLLTSNNHMATIKQGTELPYEVSSGSNGATSIEFKSAVLGLEVTPQILPNKKVNLSLFITQNAPGRTIKQSNGGEVLAIDTQEIRTQVIVSDNETLVLGGVFQQSKISSHEKVPVLGDIPLVGKLFSRESNQQNKRELIIFITPTLVDI